MEVKVEEVSGLTRRIEVILPREVAAKEIELAYDRLKKEVNLKGFRKGKAPRQVLEKSYGPKVEYEVADKLIQDTYFDALEKAALDAVVHPEIREHRFENDGSFFYQAEVDIRPQFELGVYQGIEVEQPEATVAEAEIDEEVEAIRRRIAPLKGVEERAIADGDVVNIDFKGFEQGKPMPQVGGDDFTVEVGSGQHGKEFEEKLLGLRKGEEANPEVEFPATFPNPVLAGKKVEFRIKVKDVQERVLPALDDELAKDLGGKFQSLAELREHIRSERLHRKQEGQRGDLVDRLMKQILAKHQFEVPPRLVAHEIESMIKELETNFERQGVSLEAAGINRDSLIEKYKEAGERRVRGDFILKKIAEHEKISLSDEDIEKGFQRIADQYRMKVEEVKSYFRSRNELLPFMHELLSEKIIDFLISAATIKNVPAAEAAAQTGENA